MPVPPPPLRQSITISARRIGCHSITSNSSLKARRLSSSTPLLQSTPFLHRRPLFPLSSRTARLYSTNGGANSGKKQSFSQRLREALSKTKIEWYPLPVGVGIGFLAFTQFRRNAKRNLYDEEESHEAIVREGGGNGQKPKKRIRPDGPWQVQVLSTLPLKAFSRAWGHFNQIELPRFLRIPGFKLYSWIFGVNLSEVAEPDLRTYRNLSEFFYRQLKPGVRPIDPRPAALVSPSDGTVLHFGEVRPGGEVEQVKGMTYSLDALLGAKTIGDEFPVSPATSRTGNEGAGRKVLSEGGVVDPDEQFAIVNGISYTIPSLLRGDPDDSRQSHTRGEVRDSIAKPVLKSKKTVEDVSLPSSELPQTEDAADVAREVNKEWWSANDEKGKRMYFCVIYLAPGDYHRFHSPVDWVVERRRHFAGELYSVSPYLQRTLPGLFTLNERVALLGRWRHGLFTMTPVGATNVGSIIINFDKELRTNSLTHDSKAETAGGFYEAVYQNASWLLGGQPMKKGWEMGGFQLGSTIVLIFEAPEGGDGKPGWKWECKRGGKVVFGEALGIVE